jgi:hypothetical protein
MFHFKIRDLLWLTVVVALGVGWWVDHRRLTAPRFSFRIKTGTAVDPAGIILAPNPPNPSAPAKNLPSE